MSMILNTGRLFIVLILFLSQIDLANGATVIPMGSTWQDFRGDATPSPNDASAWRQRLFDDRAWRQGAAPFCTAKLPFPGPI